MKKKSNLKNNKDIRFSYLEKISKFCDKCGSPYSIEDLQVIKKTKSVTIIHFTCSVCKASKFVQVANMHKPEVIQQMAETDLKTSELPSFVLKRPVSLNDVIDIYSYLKKKRGRIKV